MFSYRDKDRRVQGLLREKFAKQLLYQRDTNRLQQNTRRLQTNAQNQVNRMLVIIARKQTRIGELLREKFVFQLVIRQRDQNILNLQGQILALQNNPPNIQRIGMAGYIPPSFSGNYDEDIDYFINEFRRYLTASGNNLANNADRISALGFFKSCLKGKAGEWLEREIAGKNWELSNIISTVNRTLAQLQGDEQARIVGHLSPTVPAGLNAQLVVADAGAGALVIPGHTVFNEDWTPAGGKPTSKVVCAPNANLPNRTVVLADITLGQLIDYFKGNYPTVRQQYQQALFGITVQGSDSVGSYYPKLKKIARHANMGDDEFRRRFLGGLSSDNQMEVHCMGLSRPIDEIFSSLEEIERYKAELVSGTNPLLQSQQYIQPSQSYLSTEIEKLKSELTSLRAQQLAQPAQVCLQNDEALEKMYIRAVRLGMPPNAPRDLTSLDNYINDKLIKRLGTNDANNAKLSKLMVNIVKKLNKSGRKSTRKTFKTKKKKSKNKSKKKKSKRGREHIARIDEQSESDTSAH